jgi:hypothetical protein
MKSFHYGSSIGFFPYGWCEAQVLNLLRADKDEFLSKYLF